MLGEGDFVLAGSCDRPLPKEGSQGDDLRKLGLGTNVLYWFGDDPALGTQAGVIPTGYDPGPLYKEWIRGVHAPGFLTFGPYVSFPGVGSFNVWFFIEIRNRGGAGEDVLTADITDSDNAGAILATVTLKVGNFPAGIEGFQIFTQKDISLPSNHKIESRIFAHGGANIKLWGIRWEVYRL